MSASMTDKIDVRDVDALFDEAWDEVTRAQKERDARGFIQRHGGLWQTELDALDPDILRQLYVAEFEQVWDMSAYQRQLDAEPDLIDEVLGE